MARKKYPAAYCTHLYTSGQRCKNKISNNVRLCHHHVKQLGVDSTDTALIRAAQTRDLVVDRNVSKHIVDTADMCDYCECRGIAYSSPTADICWACATGAKHTRCNDIEINGSYDTVFMDDRDEMDVLNCAGCRIEIATDIRLEPSKHICKINSAVFKYNSSKDSWEQEYE